MRSPCIRVDAFNAQAETFVALHEGAATPTYVRNVGARVVALRAGGLCVPATVNRADAGDAWICSPRTTYCDYAAEELERLGRPLLRRLLAPAIGAVGRGMGAARLDRCVAVNNWLVSTNSYPDADAGAIRALVESAVSRWPRHALWFRSLTREHNAAWIDALRGCGARLVPSRQVYLFDDIAMLEREHADVAKDFALLRRSRLQALSPEDMAETDYDRAAALYALLYLGKYSRLNPDYTPALIRAWHRAGLLQLHGQRDQAGDLEAVVGMLRFGNLITSPIVGYDTARPRRDGLYRLLSANVLHQAMQARCTVNLSAGVAHFKRQRGGVPAIEYSAVVAGHLPLRTRAALGLLRGATQGIGVPLMRGLRL